MSVSAPVIEFPVLLAPAEGGRPLAYLDSAATSQTPRPVLDAMAEYYEHTRASVHRGVYPLAARSTELFEGARERVAAFVGSTPRETIFTRNATEAVNLVAHSWGRANVGAGDLVVITQMEHHSNLVPWQVLCQQVGAELAYVRVDDEGRLDQGSLAALLARGPKLVAVTHVSNVLGTVNPVADIVARAHEHGAMVLVDGSQAVPHMPVDVAAIDADFYIWTGHKAYGPTGVGILHGRYATLAAMPPFLTGGHMIASVTEQATTYTEPPGRFEAGTSAIAEVIGLGAAVDLLAGIGMDAVAAHGREQVGHMVARLAEVEGVTVLGPPSLEDRGAAVSFTLDIAHPHDVAEIVGREGVCVRAGHHCAQPLMARLGVGATTRASVALHTTHEDTDRLIDGLGTVRSIFGD